MKNGLFEEKNLRDDERAVLALRSIYEKYGYAPYRMSKFEEYELYIRNKDFLVSDRVITFNDTNGKLLALKLDDGQCCPSSRPVTISPVLNRKSITMKTYTVSLTAPDASKRSCRPV